MINSMITIVNRGVVWVLCEPRKEVPKSSLGEGFLEEKEQEEEGLALLIVRLFTLLLVWSYK